MNKELTIKTLLWVAVVIGSFINLWYFDNKESSLFILFLGIIYHKEIISKMDKKEKDKKKEEYINFYWDIFIIFIIQFLKIVISSL